jgi:1-aminocyclopropane-1-carboxylate deaminase/D-cysteine desulfhydrase-like pyridoxal-dependent ACC family enzyme
MWHDVIYDLTPVQQLGNGKIFWKRDDLFAPMGTGGINGSKLRQLIWLIHNRRPSDKGVISGAVKGSPQHPMTAAVAQHYGLPCIQFVGGKDESHPMIALAKQFGAEIRHANPGYAGNLNAQAKKYAEQHSWFHVETNITVEHDRNEATRVEGFHRVGSEQCRNIPDSIENILIPAGSCNSLTSILYGLARFKPKSLKTVHLFRIMANTAKHQKWVNERINVIRKLTGSPLELPYKFVEHPLVDDGFCTYEDMMPFTLGEIEFHPRYEGKILNYIEKNPSKFEPLMNDKTLFWIVGSEPLKAQTCSHRVNPAPVRHGAMNDIFYSPAGATHQTPGLQLFFERHPIILLTSIVCHRTSWIFPRKSLPKPEGGSWVPDFMICDWTSVGPLWTVVELESPIAKTTNSKGISGKCRHALQQIEDYRNHLRKHAAFLRDGGYFGIHGKCRAWIIIGRTEERRPIDCERLAQLREYDVEIASYDRLLRDCAQIVRSQESSRRFWKAQFAKLKNQSSAKAMKKV